MARKKAPQGALAEVAVMATIRHPLTYRFPEAGLIRPGQRVIVPLAARRATGIVLHGVARAAPGFEIRDILGAMDNAIVDCAQ